MAIQTIICSLVHFVRRPISHPSLITNLCVVCMYVDGCLKDALSIVLIKVVAGVGMGEARVGDVTNTIV